MSCKKIKPYCLGRTEDLPKVEFPTKGYLFFCNGRKNNSGISGASITICPEEETEKPEKGYVFAKSVTLHKNHYTGDWEVTFDCGYLPKQLREHLKIKARDVLKYS